MRNTLNMEMVEIPAGAFDMGCADGNFDERPVHHVTLSRPFLMAATQVTNAQYERVDPAHVAWRGTRGLSCADDEVVIGVSWHEAMAFCRWLSEREDRPYRLPTEAEWEYACRAGTTTPFHSGDTLPDVCHRHQEADWNPHSVSLRVGQTPPNTWGLLDMHGLVEEWCLDTYGPYEAEPRIDPTGRNEGDFKVTRGGSHNTELAFLRSACRLGTLPEDRHWLIGFRVVCADMPASRPLPPPPPPRWAQQVRSAVAGAPRSDVESAVLSRSVGCAEDSARSNRGTDRRPDWTPAVDMTVPFFAPPQRFVRIPPKSDGPLYYMHNHAPTVTWCDNGDLLAAWFTTRLERGRELAIAASRLRAGASEWEPADIFFKAPGRNMTGTSLLNDGRGTLYHINGLEAGARWANLALTLRTSTDNGATWSHPRLIAREHQLHNQPLSAMIKTCAGVLVQPCDASWNGFGGTTVHVSTDGGRAWFEPGANSAPPVFAEGLSGALIAGTHAGVVERRDGSLMALGRSDRIDGRMPMSVSSDMGRSWTYSASPFPPLHWGQRLALLRLREGPLLLCSFTNPLDEENPAGLELTDASGATRRVFGLFATLSEDDGMTWPHRRLVTEDKCGVTQRWIGTPIHKVEDDGAASPGLIRNLDASHAEPKGYLCATQTPDGMIHLLSSMMHYQFNLAWLKTRPPALEAP